MHSLQTENIKLSDSLQAVKSRATTLEYDLEAVQKENEQLKERLQLCSLSYDRLKKTKSLLKFYSGLEVPSFDFLLDIVGESKTESCRHTVLVTDN